MAAENRLSREERSGPAAMQIKRFNRASLMRTASALVLFRLARQKAKAPIPNEADLLLLHETGMRFLIAKPGRYRDFDFHIVDEGAVVFRGALVAKLPALMRRFFRDLAAVWRKGDALDVAAFALWWINWIHPFDDGNGRTAMAFSYACFCLKLGAKLPGVEAMFDSIVADKARYRRFVAASDHARATAAGPARTPDLRPLKDYLDGLLAERFAAGAKRRGRKPARSRPKRSLQKKT